MKMKKNFALSALAALVIAATALTGCKSDDPVKVSSVTVDPPSKTLAIGQTVTLTASLLPEEADNKTFSWSSSADAVATVDTRGVVTAVSAGTADIIATAGDGSGKSGRCTVSVFAPTVSIVGDGIDLAVVQTIRLSEAESAHVQVNVAATGGIDKLLVEIASSSPTFLAALAVMGMDREFDLANPGAELAGQLSTLAGLLPYGDAVKNKTELPFDISNFISMIFAVTADEGGDVTAEFKLTVHDAYNKSDSKTLKLNLVRETQLPNGGFEDWQTINSKIYPYGEGQAQFWDTANGGLNYNNPPTYAVETGLRSGTTGTRAVEMKAIKYLGQFAAGNLYTGSFGNVTLSPIGANVNFGRPFTGRPTALKGWYKASPGTITDAKAASGKVVGDPDEYQIYVMLTNWDKPRVVNTGNASTLIDFGADYVIGVGQISDTGVDTKLPVNDWTQFNIPIVYKSEATPTHIVVVACVSKWADYLTGSTDSKLWIDDFELVY